MNKINICYMIGGLYVGGAEEQLLQILQNIDRKKYNPIVAVFWNEGPLQKKIERLGIKIVEFKYKRFRYLFFKQLLPFVRFLKREKIRIIHIHLVSSFLFGMIGAYLAGIPVKIITLHSVYKKSLKLRSKLALKLAIRLSSRIIAVSEKVKAANVAYYGARPEKISMVYNGVNIEQFNKAKKGNIRKEFDIKDSTVLVGNAGGINPWRGHEYLIQAAKQVVTKMKNIRFLIAGTGPIRKRLEGQVVKAGLKKQFSFIGFREDIPDFLADIDIFAIPSLREGFCVALIEAMAASKPIIATDVGGNAEAIVHGKTGYIIKPKDTKALAERILVLAKDTQLREKIGQEGKKRVEKYFSSRVMARKLEKIYMDLIEENNVRL